jgi:ketosteroid isomerase-like protein
MTRILFAYLYLSAITLCACSTPPASTATAASPTATVTATENVEQVVSQLEQEWTDAIIKRDLATIDRIVADDFSGILWDGNSDSKAQHLESVRSGRYKLEAAKLDISKVRVFGDIALVTLTITEKSQLEGKDSSGKFLYTDIWNKRNGRWQIVAAHGCKAPDK